MITSTDHRCISTPFEDVVLPHLDAAYCLARWLIRNERDAEDIVEEAWLRARRHFRTFAGGNGRAWFLRIVRNTCCSWSTRSANGSTHPLQEDSPVGPPFIGDADALLRRADATLIDETLRHLPDRFRELLVLRELEGLSYQELAEVLDVPIEAVMSGLARARQAFHNALAVAAQSPRPMPDVGER